MTDLLPDDATPFGARVRERLERETVTWLITVGRDGTPQPNPVWFLWEPPDTILVYNRADASRLVHLTSRPRVALHFDGNGQGGDVVVLTGTARLAADRAGADGDERYLAKYAAAMTRVSGSPAEFALAYPAAVEITVQRVRGF